MANETKRERTQMRDGEFQEIASQFMEAMLDCAGDYCDLDEMAARAVDAAEALERQLAARGRI